MGKSRIWLGASPNDCLFYPLKCSIITPSVSSAKTAKTRGPFYNTSDRIRFKTSVHTPIEVMLGVGAGGIRYVREGKSLKSVLYDGKNYASVRFEFYQFPGCVFLNNSGNTIETTPAHPALKSNRFAAKLRAADGILRQIH